MREIDLLSNDIEFFGALSLEHSDEGILPWRGHAWDVDLYHPDLAERMRNAAGVRIAFAGNPRSIELTVAAEHDIEEPRSFDLVVNNQRVQRVTQPRTETKVAFETDGTYGSVEIYLPQFGRSYVQSLRVDDAAIVRRWIDTRPLWVTHGSSITQCRQSKHPTATWPAIVATMMNLHHVNLGYGGQCKLDPMVARMIRDMPADLISLCLGINVHSDGYHPRTFEAAAIGFLRTVLDGHPDTPIAVISPIIAPKREAERGATGLTLPEMREILEGVVNKISALGFERVRYVDGLKLFPAEAVAERLPDQLHPHEDGAALLAQGFFDHAIPAMIFA